MIAKYPNAVSLPVVYENYIHHLTGIRYNRIYFFEHYEMYVKERGVLSRKKF